VHRSNQFRHLGHFHAFCENGADTATDHHAQRDQSVADTTAGRFRISV
jgi:hypothetical protein